MKNPFLNLDSNENLVSNSNYLNKGDVFLSIKGGVKFLNNEDISKAKSIFIDQEDIISSNPKLLILPIWILALSFLILSLNFLSTILLL